MRYWSDEHGTYLECEVIWSGKGEMPHEQDRSGWRQRESAYSTKHGEKKGAFISPQEARKLAPADVPFGVTFMAGTPTGPKPAKCACGRPKLNTRAKGCKRCRQTRNSAASLRARDAA